MFEKLMETLRHILLFWSCRTGISDESWDLWDQGLCRLVLPTSSMQIWYEVWDNWGYSVTLNMGHFKHPQTSVEGGRVGGQR